MVLLMYLSCDCQEEEEKKDEVLSMSMEFKVYIRGHFLRSCVHQLVKC